ncbi:hypothetical protein L3X38_010551 [Prunus dulcis]|uniref:Uncharacterized protein n=1 Tax=Prunus dulcis TaxID=3755 RepID=A0AAD4WFU7_PRUDU|nr:hypothetical protein L3X38_010551 [Prunus dulcis]
MNFQYDDTMQKRESTNEAPYGLPASELPKGLVLDGCECAHIRHSTPPPLVDVGSYNPSPLKARRPRRYTRTTRQSGSDTKLSHPGINSTVARYCPHGFVSGSSRATSQWVTHPGIALAPNSLNFGVPTTPKPVSSQKASC